MSIKALWRERERERERGGGGVGTTESCDVTTCSGFINIREI